MKGESAMAESFGEKLAEIVGERHVLSGEDIPEHYRVDVMGRFSSSPGWVAKPADHGEVAAVVRLAHGEGVPITVIGGQSGTAGGAVPSDGGLGLSLERMNRILEIDTLSMTMTVRSRRATASRSLAMKYCSVWVLPCPLPATMWVCSNRRSSGIVKGVLSRKSSFKCVPRR